MDVQNSILNSSTYLCIAPDGSPTYSEAISAGVYFLPGEGNGCSNPGAIKEENDDGEPIGKPVGPKGDNLSESDVQNALALSSNTAFDDLTHRATTTAVVNMAQAYGVDIVASGLKGDIGEVPQVALGASSLSVNEQAQMLATIDDDGTYHAGHVIKYWQLPAGPKQTPDVVSRVVLTPALDSQVQYAMDQTTVYGTGTNAAVGLGSRPIIGKTGTTSGEKSAFFLGAIPQYALAVGMFAQSQSPESHESMADLGGSGVGGYWPAKIWNTFAQAEFGNLPVQSFQNPEFTGSLWNMIGKLPKAKPKKKTTPKCHPGKVHGRPGPVMGAGCATTSPTATPSATPTGVPTGLPTGIPTGLPTATPTGLPTGTPTGTATGTPPPSPGAPTPTTTQATLAAPRRPAATPPRPTESGVKSGLAVGGVLVTVLPGSLLWTTASRRRRRKRRAGAGSAPGTGTQR